MEKGFEEFLEQMQQSYQQMSGMKAQDASDIGIRFKILAEQLAGLNEELKEAQKQAFPQTATGEYLDMHALQRGLKRKEAIFAKGTVVFSRSQQAQTDIEIPSGIYLTGSSMGKEDGEVRFITTEAGILQQGERSVELPVQCLSAGSYGNLAAGVLDVMITPVQGISSVNNPDPIDSGEDAESDDRLRQRLMDSYRMVTNGTNGAFYYHSAMGYPGVSSVKVLPRVNGVGTVGIVVYGPGVDEQLIQKIKDEIGFVKEINVDITVEQATEKEIDLSVEIAAADGYSYEDVKEVCREALTDFMKKQKIGQPLYSALLVRELLSCEGVNNCKVLLPEDDLYPLEKEIFVLSQLSIAQMEH